MNNKEILNTIKRISHRASEDYLLMDTNMNENIASQCAPDINVEIVRRICESANQNVYMSILNDSTANRGDIKFDMANYNEIIDNINKSEDDMNSYSGMPNSFKDDLNATSNQSETELNKVASYGNEFDIINEYELSKEAYDTCAHMSRSIETLKAASLREASDHYNSMLKTAKLVIGNGESIGDMAKIATRASKEAGLDFIKVAEAYVEISEELKKEGHNVNEDLTKVSSLTIDKTASEVGEAIGFSKSIASVQAFNEMGNEVKSMENEYKGIMNKMAELVGR